MIEHADIAGAVAYRLAIHLHLSRRQQQAGLSMAAMRQVGEEAVEAHQLSGDESPRAQRAQRQALFRASLGIRWRASGALMALKHQQGCSAPCGWHWSTGLGG